MNTLYSQLHLRSLKKATYVCLLVTCISFFSSLSHATPAFRCEYLVSPESFKPKFKMEELYSDYIIVNDALVSGEFLYNLEFVNKSLKISNAHLAKWHGKKILSLAEGVSGLVPNLLRHGHDVTGVDLIYSTENLPRNFSGNLVREYMNHYGPHLVLADARRTPFADGSVDILLSHMLVNNINQARKQSVLKEVMRLLNPKGGEARIYNFDSTDAIWIQNLVAKQCKDCKVERFEQVFNEVTYNGKTTKFNDYLLVIKRQSK